MSPQELNIMIQRIKKLNDAHLHRVIMFACREADRRGGLLKRIRKWDGHWISKDCNPNHES